MPSALMPVGMRLRYRYQVCRYMNFDQIPAFVEQAATVEM